MVSFALLLAMQTASRRLSVLGGLVTLVVQAFTVSMSAVVLTLKVRLAGVVMSVGADCAEVRTTRSREASIFCGMAKAATGALENEMAALGLAALPEVSRMFSWLRPASRTIRSLPLIMAMCAELKADAETGPDGAEAV